MDEHENSGKKRRDRIQGIRDAMNQSMGIELGKLPPQSVDLEEAVLGACMLESNSLTAVVEFLKPYMFYKEANAKIFDAILGLLLRAEPVDILTVTHQLRKQASLELVGGPLYIASLTNRVASTANVETHARIIHQKYIARSLISISNNIIRDAYDETTDVLDLMEEAQKMLLDIESGIGGTKTVLIGEAARTHIDNISNSVNAKNEMIGITTGIHKLNDIMGGWVSPDLIIIGARPGMGKTGFIISVLRGAASEGIPVAFFTLEMSKEQIASRVMAQEIEYDLQDERRGLAARSRVLETIIGSTKITKISNMPFYVDDTPALRLFEFRSKVRRLVTKHGVQLVAIDYLQLMSAEGKKGQNKGIREQEISEISRGLKLVAKENGIPIIALSQLGRQVELRANKKPQLSDLRESGAIEQDADMIMFLMRPEYYGEETLEDGTPTEGVGLLEIAKFRNGPTDKPIILSFIKQTTEWCDYSGSGRASYSGPRPNTGFDQKPPQTFSDLENDELFN